MSYILDALKKSEQDRLQKENAAPAEASWVTTPQVAVSSSLLPGLFIGVVLAVVLVVLYWVLAPEKNATHDNSEVPTALPVEKLPAVPVQAKEITLPERKVVTLESEVVIAEAAETIKPQPSQTENSGTQINVPAVTRAKRVLPPLTVLRKVPDLIITGHIYSSVADKRSVSINGRDWNEGDYLSDTIQIKEITSDGVVMDVEGWSLPLKRNKGWQAIQ